MKNHVYKLNLCIHSISIHVSFPCTVGASLQIDNQQWQITDNIDIKQAQQSINAPVQTEVSLLFNPRTNVYSIKKAVINFFLRTKSGKLQAGSTTVFLNKTIDGVTKQVASISKCSDREAVVQYSMHLQLLQQTDSTMTASMFKGSQTSDANNSLKNSTVSYTKRLFQQTNNLYESIVHQVDEKTDQAWDKGSNGSKGNSLNNSFISDLKHTQSSKIISPGWRNQTQSLFRKSRIDNSVEQPRKSSIYSNNANYQSKFSASKAQFQRDEEDTKLVLQRKVMELQRQNKEIKQTLNLIQQKYEERMLQERTSMRKSQISQSTLKEELELMKQKFGGLEKQTNKMMFEKNEILNKYNTREAQNISQIKAKQKTLILENKRLGQKSEKLQKLLTQQQEKYKATQSRLNQQQSIWVKKQKQFNYYQQEAMQLDEKLSELRLVEEQLNQQIQTLKQQMARRQQSHEKELLKYKKDLSSIKEVKDHESKGLGKQVTDLRNSIKEKENQIKTLTKQLDTEKKQLTKQQVTLKQQKEKLEKQLNKANEQKNDQQQNSFKLQQTIATLSEKMKMMTVQMQNLVQNRDQVLMELQTRLQQLNVQQFKLNEHNFQLEERIAILQRELKQKQSTHQSLSEQQIKLKESLVEKESQIRKLTKQLEQNTSVKSSTESQVRQLKRQLTKRQQTLTALQKKMQLIQAELTASHNQNHSLEIESYKNITQQNQQIDSLNAQITSLQDTINNQAQQIQSLEQQIQSLNQQTQSLNSTISTLSKQNEQHQNSQTTLKHQLQLTKQKVNQFQIQLAQTKSQTLKERQNASQYEQIQIDTEQCIQLFEEMFSTIIAKDYQSTISTSKSPSTYKYSTNNRSIPASTGKKNVSQMTDFKKLNSYSKKNVQFAQNLTKKLEELQQFLIKTTQKQQENRDQLNKTIKSLQNSQAQIQRKNHEISQLTSQIDKINAQNTKLNQQLTLQVKNAQKSSKQYTSLNNKFKDIESRAEKQKALIEDLRQEIGSKVKQISTLKNSIFKSSQTLKDSQNSFQQSKQKVQTEINQVKGQLIQIEKQLANEKQQGKKKQVRISELENLLQNLRNEHSKVLNQLKKQNMQSKRELTQTKKQFQKKNIQITRAATIQAQLNKKIQTITAQSKDNLEKFQKSNQELMSKNKQINQLQLTIRQRVAQLSKAKARTLQLEQQLSKVKKEKDDQNKSLIIQQQQNGKNLLTVKQQKQLLTKKDEMLKEIQKELKLMEGQLFNQKRLKTQQLNTEDSEISVSSNAYSYRKIEPKKQPDHFSPTISAFSYRKSYQTNKNDTDDQPESQPDQLMKEQVKSLKEQLSVKQKTITELQQKLKSTVRPIKQNSFSKTANSSFIEPTSKGEEQMKQQILDNLQSIEIILSSPDSGSRFDKYKLELSTLINKNKKIILEASPFEQMRKLNMLIQKAKTSIQNKLKLQNDAKTFIIDEFLKIQTIVDEVMGK